MATRYCGDVRITARYFDCGHYEATVKAPGVPGYRGTCQPAASGFGAGVAYDSPAAYDEICASALSFACHFSGQRSEIESAADLGASGWRLRRSKDGPIVGEF